MVTRSNRRQTEERDAVIIGAGAAGALYARHLAEAGKSVTVLEAGPGWALEDLTSSQIWSRRLRWAGPGVLPGGDHPYPFAFNSGWGLGGAALHHYGTWPRMHEEDFDMARRHGRGRDWPIAYDNLRPFYDRMQREAGVSGDAEAEIWRPPGDPYPLPPLATLAQAQVLKRGFDALGVAAAPAPMAILSRGYDGRPPCIYDGWCDAGCPIGALYNPLVKDIPRARAAGAEFRIRATALRILMESGRARGVEYLDGEGEIREARGRVVILAASVVHNPALLLNSASDAHPDGLANSSRQLGRNFMCHILAPVYGIFDEETQPYLGVSGAQLISHADYGKSREGGPFGSWQWLVAPAMKPNDLLGVAISRADLFGQDLHDFMARASHHIASMIAFAEELPRPENRIELSDAPGPGGTRLPRLVHGFDAETLALREAAKDQGLAILEAAGAREIWQGPVAQAHMMGGAIMGDDPAASVADSFGRAHDVANLVIAGASLFPTGGAVNPTFTLYALSLRNVEHLIAHWTDYAA